MKKRWTLGPRGNFWTLGPRGNFLDTRSAKYIKYKGFKKKLFNVTLPAFNYAWKFEVLNTEARLKLENDYLFKIQGF